MPPDKAPRNRTLTLSEAEKSELAGQLVSAKELSDPGAEGVACADIWQVAPTLPRQSFDLLFLDPPYNLSKTFGQQKFGLRPVEAYTEWLGKILDLLLPLCTPQATIYICGDWRTSFSIHAAAMTRLQVHNRITWEREKGRGARRNWKNCAEDIWFCTLGKDYYFDAHAVQLRRRVRAPYTDRNGAPKDWKRSSKGNFRDTAPSNLWTDISIPFWSMPENTEHPTQKSEKLLAKLILASTPTEGRILDPFLGSGTTTAVARKLGRRALGIELDRDFALLAQKRLHLAAVDARIQGYTDGVFWERNTLVEQEQSKAKDKPQQ